MHTFAYATPHLPSLSSLEYVSNAFLFFFSFLVNSGLLPLSSLYGLVAAFDIFLGFFFAVAVCFIFFSVTAACATGALNSVAYSVTDDTVNASAKINVAFFNRSLCCTLCCGPCCRLRCSLCCMLRCMLCCTLCFRLCLSLCVFFDSKNMFTSIYIWPILYAIYILMAFLQQNTSVLSYV